MASDSPPGNTTNEGPSSPDENASSPIANTYYSSPAEEVHKPLHRLHAMEPQTPLTPPPTSRPSYADEAPPSSGEEDDANADDNTAPTFLWGTNISVQDVKSAIGLFVKHFREAKDSSEDLFREGKCMASIRKVIEIEGEWIDVDAFDYDPDLYNKKIVRYPLEVLTIFDIVLMDIIVSSINRLFEKHIQVRIF